MTRRNLVGCLLLLVALGAGAAVLAWRVFTPPVVVQRVPLSELSPEERERRSREADSLVRQIRQIASSARRKEHKAFRLQANEEQLNTLLQENLGQKSELPVRDIKVGLRPDLLVLQGVVDYKGLDAVATLQGKLLAREGKLAYEVVSLQLGGLPAPSKLRRQIEETATKHLNQRLFENAPVHLDRVTLEDQLLTIEGVTD